MAKRLEDQAVAQGDCEWTEAPAGFIRRGVRSTLRYMAWTSPSERVDETFALPIVALRCRSPQHAASSGRGSPFHSLGLHARSAPWPGRNGVVFFAIGKGS